MFVWDIALKNGFEQESHSNCKRLICNPACAPTLTLESRKSFLEVAFLTYVSIPLVFVHTYIPPRSLLIKKKKFFCHLEEPLVKTDRDSQSQTDFPIFKEARTRTALPM